MLQQPGGGYNPPYYKLHGQGVPLPFDGRFHILTAGWKQSVRTDQSAILSRYAAVDGGSVQTDTLVAPNPGCSEDGTTWALFNEPAYFAVGGNAMSQFISRIFGGNIAEVIIFNRLLSDSEIALVTDYLKAKHGVL